MTDTNAPQNPTPQQPEPAPCPHPPARQFAWHADAPTGPVLCIGCCDCGAVLKGGAE